MQRAIDPAASPFEKFQVGDHVAHISRGDGKVIRNDGRYIEVLYIDGRGVYDGLWFGLYPTWLFHRNTEKH